MSEKKPTWLRGVIGNDGNAGGTISNEVPGNPGGEASSPEVSGLPAVSPFEAEITNVRENIDKIIQERKFTGFHLILHYYDPKTDDETWEAVTMGMTIKDLVFASVNMSTRINDLMSSAQEDKKIDE